MYINSFELLCWQSAMFVLTVVTILLIKNYV